MLAGGGLRHGQVIGATEADGGAIKSARSRPATWRRRSTATWACRSTPCITITAAARGRFSITANRFESCFRLWPVASQPISELALFRDFLATGTGHGSG